MNLKLIWLLYNTFKNYKYFQEADQEGPFCRLCCFCFLHKSRFHFRNISSDNFRGRGDRNLNRKNNPFHPEDLRTWTTNDHSFNIFRQARDHLKFDRWEMDSKTSHFLNNQSQFNSITYQRLVSNISTTLFFSRNL